MCSIFSSTNLYQYVKTCKFETRPNAECGYWLFFILPLCVIVSAVKLGTISPQYYQMHVFSLQLLLASFIFTRRTGVKLIYKNRLLVTIGGILTIIGSKYAGLSLDPVPIFLSFCFFILHPALLKAFPNCFTIGEAALISQALLMFFYATFTNILTCIATRPPITDLHTATTILQIGVLSMIVFATLIRKFKYLQKPYNFYITFGVIVGFGMMFPMYVVLQRDPLVWVLEFIVNSPSRLGLVAYCLFCVILAAVVTNKQIEEKRRANTVKRKIFHLLAVCVYLPSLIYQCTFIYLASGVALAFFILLELIRLYDIPPLGSSLHDGFLIFVDEKDSTGGISLSPIYLLVGISLPMWIHPYCCDITDSAGFQLLPLISGLLTVGIGDTAASAFGLTLGKHHWNKSKKTIEGTIGAIIVQCTCLVSLIYLGFVGDHDIVKGIIAIVITSIVEAKTDQVDNLVLPLLGYLLLI